LAVDDHPKVVVVRIHAIVALILHDKAGGVSLIQRHLGQEDARLEVWERDEDLVADLVFESELQDTVKG